MITVRSHLRKTKKGRTRVRSHSRKIELKYKRKSYLEKFPPKDFASSEKYKIKKEIIQTQNMIESIRKYHLNKDIKNWALEYLLEHYDFFAMYVSDLSEKYAELRYEVTGKEKVDKVERVSDNLDFLSDHARNTTGRFREFIFTAKRKDKNEYTKELIKYIEQDIKKYFELIK